MNRTAVFAGTVALAGFSLAIACSTSDPRAGTRNEGTGGTGGSNASGSGGIDATAPEGPIDCGPAPVSTAAFTKAALLDSAAECAAWHSCTFLNAATALKKSFAAHATAPTDATKTTAQADWKAAMASWSAMELFQFGPIGGTEVDPYHGRGLRAFVHPWPQVSRCEVEKQIASKEYATAGIEKVLPSARGLFALEYALFYPGVDTACLPASPTGVAFSQLSPADLTKAKHDYASVVADNVLALALEIRNVWLPAGENFKAKLTSFDKYGSEQETLNVLAWSLFYFEQEVKDIKIAPLAGVQATSPNPETPFAKIDVENVRTNLRAFRALFQGCGEGGAGIGFDDWLIAAGHGTLASELLTELAEAQAAVDAFPAFEQASQAQFLALYEKIRPLSTTLKTQMFGSSSPLNLRLPASAASDTD